MTAKHGRVRWWIDDIEKPLGCRAPATKVVIRFPSTASIHRKYDRGKLKIGDVCEVMKGTNLRCGDRMPNEYYCDKCVMKAIW